MFSYRRHRLVLGCGSACKNHNTDKWFTIDTTDSKKPDLIKEFNDLTPQDFGKNGGEHKFKIIFAEHLNLFNPMKMSKLKELFDEQDGRAIIFYGWQGSWNDYFKAGLNVQYFIFYHNKTILFTRKELETFKNTLEIIQVELCEENCGETYKKILEVMQAEIIRLRGELPRLHPLLISVLAHLHAYVITRKERNLVENIPFLGSIPFRNVFNDKKYEKFLTEITEVITRFGSGTTSLEDARRDINKWKSRLPSTAMPTQKVSYTPLEVILGVCLNAMEYYAKTNHRVEQRPANRSA